MKTSTKQLRKELLNHIKNHDFMSPRQFKVFKHWVNEVVPADCQEDYKLTIKFLEASL